MSTDEPVGGGSDHRAGRDWARAVCRDRGVPRGGGVWRLSIRRSPDAVPGTLDKAMAHDYEFGNVNPSDPASDIYDHTARNQANAKIKDRGFAV